MKLAIEFNGIYWHSELYKNNRYHIEKTELCEKLNIDLIHIFEDDWNYKKEIVKSIIRERLSIMTIPDIYIDTICDIREVNLIDSEDFLNKNHINGNINSIIQLGLHHNDELLALMTFNDISDDDDSIELIRYCNKSNIHNNGYEKIFHYFCEIYTHTYTYIYTHNDISMFNNSSSSKLYKQLGFQYINRTEPKCYYVIDTVRKELNDDSDSDTHLRIWDCGVDIYRYKI